MYLNINQSCAFPIVLAIVSDFRDIFSSIQRRHRENELISMGKIEKPCEHLTKKENKNFRRQSSKSFELNQTAARQLSCFQRVKVSQNHVHSRLQIEVSFADADFSTLFTRLNAHCRLLSDIFSR